MTGSCFFAHKPLRARAVPPKRRIHPVPRPGGSSPAPHEPGRTPRRSLGLFQTRFRTGQPRAWAVTADLWTAEEGHSDLSLEATIWADGTDVTVQVHNVQVR
ncbi:MAG: DUF7668 domain-containing protein [Gemmatimonadales bacterium]